MAARPTPRDITPILQKLRNLLMGRKVKNELRFTHLISPRPGVQPLPKLPVGVSHKLSDNYYYTRDGRRDVQPPESVFTSHVKAVEAGKQVAEAAPGSSKRPLPGFGYDWQTGDKYYK